MSLKNYRIQFGLFLFATSAVLLSAQALFFHEGHSIAKKVLYNISFIPLQALVLTLVINGWLGSREKKQRLEKVNIAIGVFYNSMGQELLFKLLEYAANSESMYKNLALQRKWTVADFRRKRKAILSSALPVELDRGDLDALATFLMEKQGLILDLLRNPNLLEHERFTELLWAVSHLTEELLAREETGLPLHEDKAHLEADLRRALQLLMIEWLVYMEHLRKTYPFLYSFALRSSPLGMHHTQPHGRSR